MFRRVLQVAVPSAKSAVSDCILLQFEEDESMMIAGNTRNKAYFEFYKLGWPILP